MTRSTDVTVVAEAGRYTCPLCPARFDSVGDKKRHLRDSHSGGRS